MDSWHEQESALADLDDAALGWRPTGPQPVQRSLGRSPSRTRRRPCRVSARERSSTSRLSSEQLYIQNGATRAAWASWSHAASWSRARSGSVTREVSTWDRRRGPWCHGTARARCHLRRLGRADLRELAPKKRSGGLRRRSQEVRHIAAARQHGQQRHHVEPAASARTSSSHGSWQERPVLAGQRFAPPPAFPAPARRQSGCQQIVAGPHATRPSGLTAQNARICAYS